MLNANKTIGTKDIYDFDKLYELLEANKGRDVRLQIAKTSKQKSETIREKLDVSKDNNSIIINGNVIFKNDITDVCSGTYFGNWINIEVQNSELIKLSVVLDERKVIDDHETNLSFNTTDYWNRIVEIYNQAD
jgi:hypothetical protein